VILNEIYDAKGREELADQNVSSQDICREIVKRGWLEAAAVTYSPNLFVTEKEIKAAVQPGDVVLIMGAGDMDVVARKITGSR
jgi:UDP-N-acetylmuramate-alanine ligase